MPMIVPGTLRRFSLLLALFAMLVATPVQGVTQEISPDLYESLTYRHIGPVGNRIASVAGVPGDPLTYYAGAASGGIWKSEDGGEYWEPIFDGETDHSIGALAVAPSDPEIIWAGTGEPHIRSNVSLGTGVYKSTDGAIAGGTWGSARADRHAHRGSSFIRRTATSCTWRR